MTAPATFAVGDRVRLKISPHRVGRVITVDGADRVYSEAAEVPVNDLVPGGTTWRLVEELEHCPPSTAAEFVGKGITWGAKAVAEIVLAAVTNNGADYLVTTYTDAAGQVSDTPHVWSFGYLLSKSLEVVR